LNRFLYLILARPKLTVYRLPFLSLLNFLQCLYLLLDAGKIRENLNALGIFSMIFPVSTFKSKSPFRSIWRGCTGRIWELVSYYIEASKRLKIKCHYSKLFKNFEKYQHTHKKCRFNFIVFKKISTSWHNPFKQIMPA